MAWLAAARSLQACSHAALIQSASVPQATEGRTNGYPGIRNIRIKVGKLKGRSNEPSQLGLDMKNIWDYDLGIQEHPRRWIG